MDLHFVVFFFFLGLTCWKLCNANCLKLAAKSVLQDSTGICSKRSSERLELEGEKREELELCVAISSSGKPEGL